MTVREIQGHLVELYGIDVCPDLISTIADAVLERVAEWQNRPLEASYPLVFFDALRVKIRDEVSAARRSISRRVLRPTGCASASQDRHCARPEGRGVQTSR